MADEQMEWADNAVGQLLRDVSGRPSSDDLFHHFKKLYESAADAANNIEQRRREPHNGEMESIGRPELDAKLEAIEARMDARVASIEGKIDAMIGKMASRDELYDQRFSGVEEALKDTRAAISNLKTTTLVTAISAVLAIVLGVAAFNATVLSNMVASFESGKNTSAAQADVAQQARETRQLLDELRKSMPGPDARK